MPNSRKAAL
jgi:hypothetical protein